MSPKEAGRFGALAVLAATIIASAISCSQRTPSGSRTEQPAMNAVQSELQRCHDMGTKAADDPSCQEARRRLHEHFFGDDTKGSNR